MTLPLVERGLKHQITRRVQRYQELQMPLVRLD